MFVVSKISICLKKKKHFKDCFLLCSVSDALWENGNISVREHRSSSLVHQSIPTTNPPTPGSPGAHPSQSAHSGGNLSTVRPSVPHWEQTHSLPSLRDGEMLLPVLFLPVLCVSPKDADFRGARHGSERGNALLKPQQPQEEKRYVHFLNKSKAGL